MEYLHLRDINLSNYVNDRMFVIFMLQDIKIGLQKDGVQRFASIIMQDRGVSIEAKRFGVTDNDIDRLQRGKVFCAAVDVKEYKGSNSCVIYNYDEFDESAVNFIPYCDGIEDYLW